MCVCVCVCVYVCMCAYAIEYKKQLVSITNFSLSYLLYRWWIIIWWGNRNTKIQLTSTVGPSIVLFFPFSFWSHVGIWKRIKVCRRFFVQIGTCSSRIFEWFNYSPSTWPLYLLFVPSQLIDNEKKIIGVHRIPNPNLTLHLRYHLSDTPHDQLTNRVWWFQQLLGNYCFQSGVLDKTYLIIHGLSDNILIFFFQLVSLSTAGL